MGIAHRCSIAGTEHPPGTVVDKAQSASANGICQPLGTAGKTQSHVGASCRNGRDVDVVDTGRVEQLRADFIPLAKTVEFSDEGHGLAVAGCAGAACRPGRLR